MRRLFNLILLFAAIIAGLQTHAQVVRPPIEANTVRALNELDAQQTLKFQGDALVKSEMAYIEWGGDCFRFRRITTGAAWSDWLCIDDGEQTTIGVNAQSALEIISNAINFKVQNKHTVLQSDAGNNFVFKGNVILGENFTALGFGAGQSGFDSLVAGGDTILVPAFDNQFDNVILIGHGAKERAPNTAVIGNSSLVRIWTAAAVDASAFEIKGDSVFLRHLVNLVEADSGKIAMHSGSGVVWIPQKADSIQINGEWVHLGGSFTTPDAQNLSWDSETGALGISGGTGVDLDGRYLQSETPQNLSWDSETGALGIDGGTGVDLDGRYLVPPTATDGDMMIYASGSWYATAPIDERVSVVNSEGVKSAPALLYADDFSVSQVGGAVDDWVVSVKPDSLAWNSGTRELSILGSNTVTIEDECACSGATGTFYSKEGRLVTVVNGLVVSIGAPAPLGGIWIMKTNSTSSTYTPVNVTNSGSNLIWTVSGAVSTVYNGNEPTFDFSAAGEKVMTITSTDSLKGVSAVDVLGLITYIEMQDMLLDTLLADQNEINTVKLINNNELVYADFDINSITSLTLTGLNELRVLRLNASGYFGALDLSTFANLEYIDAGDGNLSSITMPVSQDVLYYAKLNSEYWDSNDVNYVLNWCNFHGRTDHPDGGQLIMTGSGCGDLDQIENLDVAWYVEVDTCAVVFPEVTIGTQTWMAVNLDVDDGLGGIYAYDDNEANVATYGRLYSWDAAVRVAASIDGWHLPTIQEWETLANYLDSANPFFDWGNTAGGELKESGVTHWSSPNSGATNSSGFTALPSGYYRYETFDALGYYGYYWADTNSHPDGYTSVDFYYDNAYIQPDTWNISNAHLAIRLIKDTP